MKEIFISDISAWAPGLGDEEAKWQDWLEGKTLIEQSKESPKLEYTDSLFRRRLSQITKMTVHVIHNLLEKTNVDKNTKIVFVSLRGEIEREFTINKSLIEDNMILPAAFSLSVFNTPVSSATIAFGLKGGYSVIYPSKNNFADAFKISVAPVLAGTEDKIIFVYADELVPEYYGDKRPKENFPCAFSFLVSGKEQSLNASKNNTINFSVTGGGIYNVNKIPASPLSFLKSILRQTKRR